MAAGLAVTAAALVAAGPQDAPAARQTPAARHGGTARGHLAAEADRARERRRVDMVTAPVRIADAATVRLLRPGDRVDVIAAEDPATGGEARVVARGARVMRVPDPVEGGAGSGGAGPGGGSGALVALSVPRSTAARLAGASATARLAVTLC